GGNAIDAAVAVSAALGVVEPAMNGPAGNGTMLVHWAADGRTYALDFSGSVPMSAGTATTGDVYFGPRAQVVPGNVGGWCAALERRSPDAARFCQHVPRHRRRGCGRLL